MTHGSVTMTPEQRQRKRALWQARNRAYRRLAAEYPAQFERYKKEALAADGQPAKGNYRTTQEGE